MDLKKLMKLRFWLAVGGLAMLGTAFALVLFFGGHLTDVQNVLLTLIAGALISEVKASSGWVFDGVPDKPADPVPPATPTTSKESP